MVRAKVKITKKEDFGGGFRILAEPVVGGSKENEDFYAATPGGQFEMNTVNAEAAAQFEVGDEFYVDFTKAEPAKPA